MTKILLSLSTTVLLLSAGSIENELGINVGATSLHNENGSQFKNFTALASYQMSRYVVSPRFDLEYVNVSDYKKMNSLLKASINGVYEFENSTSYLPYLLAGIGYEKVSTELDNEFESHAFAQLGTGIAYRIENGNKIQLEGKLVQIVGGSEGEENEAVVTAGMSFPLNPQPQQKVVRKVSRPLQPILVKEQVPVYVDNSQCPKKIAGPDRDRDGIADFKDQCPNTPCDFTVDQYGCPVKATLKIHFKTGSAVIQDYSMSQVLNFANFLLRHKGSFVKIVGHTDNVGGDAYNMSLSHRRAKSVANKLVEYGVSTSRISTMGMGESSPIASNQTEAGKAKNRRIEAILSYPDTK